MARPADFPTLSQGATELLRISRENDAPPGNRQERSPAEEPDIQPEVDRSMPRRLAQRLAPAVRGECGADAGRFCGTSAAQDSGRGGRVVRAPTIGLRTAGGDRL